MGCVSSNLLNHDDDFPQLGGSSAFGHHMVKLTSTTYGFLTLDPPPPSPPKSLLSESKLIKSEPEVINSWELMSGLDSESFRFTPLPVTKTPVKYKIFGEENKENSDPNQRSHRKCLNEEVLKPLDLKFEWLCPPGGENRVVIYTTSLRGVRRTFEECNTVRAALESFDVMICERDVSMDRGFREELVSLMTKRVSNGKPEAASPLPPKVFVKGRYIGGAEEVLRLVEEGVLGELIRGMPRRGGCGGDVNSVCDGCGGLFFLPCFRCNGSCKLVKGWSSSAVVVKCMECNENGLVLCPICS